MLKHILLTLGLLAGYGTAQSQALSNEAWYTVPDARGVQVVHIECGADYFDPREIVVQSNLPVEFLVRTPDLLQEFISGFGPVTSVGRQPTVHRFTPNAVGHFPLFCRRPGVDEPPGEAARKRGLLTVVPANGRVR